MSDVVLDVRKLTARKQHVCDHCQKMIEAGERYERSRQIFEGEPCTYKAHIDCVEAAHALWDMQGLASDECGALYQENWEADDREWLENKYPAVAARLFAPALATEDGR